MRFSRLKKSESKLKLKVNEKDKLVNKIKNFSSNLTKEGEFYIKNNLALFMISLLALYNYDTSLKIIYLPILLGNKFLSNVGLITNLVNDL